MKLLIASDSFKGSLSSYEIGQHLKLSEEDKIISISDGGEGFTQSILFNDKDTESWILQSKDSMGKKIKIELAVKDKDVYLDVASIIALHQYPAITGLKKTTIGLGEILNKIEKSNKFENVYIGLGGSSTNDMGFFAAKAMGFKFKDQNNEEITEFSNLINFKNIEKPKLKCKYVGFTDVNNPLTGKNGSTYVFGKQKWLTKNELESTEKIFKHVSHQINGSSTVPGVGAAGGLGYFIVEMLGGELKPGIDKILELSNFAELSKNYDYVVTGEGMFDNQSFFGKVPIEVAKLSNTKVILVAGNIVANKEKLNQHFSTTFKIIIENETVEDSIKNTPKRLKNIAAKIREL